MSQLNDCLPLGSTIIAWSTIYAALVPPICSAFTASLSAGFARLQHLRSVLQRLGPPGTFAVKETSVRSLSSKHVTSLGVRHHTLVASTLLKDS